MIALPSLIKPYDFFWSEDPAIVRIPDDESELTTYHAKIKAARLTGDWSEVLVFGAQATRFRLRQIPGDVLRTLLDLESGNAALSALWVRASLVAIVGLEGLKDFSPSVDTTYPKLGKICPVSVLNTLDQISLSIVGEIALYVMGQTFLPPR